MNRYNRARLFTATALMAFASLAHAQYMWIDEKGMKQLSDRAPPPSIPTKNILKAPSGMPSAANLPAEQPADAAPSPAAKPSAPSLADRDADFKKRAKETAEREQKERADELVKRAKMKECGRALAARDTVGAGGRVRQVDKNGERIVLTEEERAAERAKLDKVIEDCK